MICKHCFFRIIKKFILDFAFMPYYIYSKIQNTFVWLLFFYLFPIILTLILYSLAIAENVFFSVNKLMFFNDYPNSILIPCFIIQSYFINFNYKERYNQALNDLNYLTLSTTSEFNINEKINKSYLTLLESVMNFTQIKREILLRALG